MADLPIGVDLKGEVCAITGGAGVLCSCMAEYIAAAGAKVAVLDIAEEQATKVANAIKKAGGEAQFFTCNVLEKESVKKCAEAIEKKYGPVTILINGAGGNSPKATTSAEWLTPDTVKAALDDEKSIFNLDEKAFQFALNLNLMGTLLPSQVFGRSMAVRGKGNIINISSMSAYAPLTKVAAYCAAKAAVTNFTEWLAVHFAKVGIRVNAIAPGFLDTAQNHFLLFNKDETLSDRGRKIMAKTPMGRFATPDELIGTLLYLLSNKAAGFVTGVVIPVDGGFTAYSGV